MGGPPGPFPPSPPLLSLRGSDGSEDCPTCASESLRGEGEERAGGDSTRRGGVCPEPEDRVDSIWRALSPPEDRDTEENAGWTVGPGTGWTAG